MFQLSSRLYRAPYIRQAVKRHSSTSAENLKKCRGGVDEIKDRVDVSEFRLMTAVQRPIVFRQQVTSSRFSDGAPLKSKLPLPALERWFIKPGGVFREDEFSAYFREYLSHIVPYELILSSGNEWHHTKASLQAFLEWLRQSPSLAHRNLHPLLEAQMRNQELKTENVATDFVRFDAPLALLDAALHFNAGRVREHCVSQLYVAQADLTALPKELQLDVPVPNLLAAPATPNARFTGDIYNSSLWLGLQPTFTPWHRDPNPNLFVQLCGYKVVKLLPPEAGEALFRKVMTRLGKPGGSSTIRGEEMMQGAERQVWHDAVWGPNAPADTPAVTVRPTDALFVPKGWWHSVKSCRDQEGGLNASVNWWFRWRNASPPKDTRDPVPELKHGDNKGGNKDTNYVTPRECPAQPISQPTITEAE